MDQNSNDDLKEKAKKSLNKIIDDCSNLQALEPLIPVSPEKILKHILNRYVICQKIIRKQKEILSMEDCKNFKKLRLKLMDLFNNLYRILIVIMMMLLLNIIHRIMILIY